jgi:hypothetical protein
MRRFFPILTAVMLLISSPPNGAAQEWRSQMSELVGQGILSVFFMDVYLLKLYSQDGTFSLNRDFVLEFTYKRPVSKDVIIDASLDEMKKAGGVDSAQLTAWRDNLGKALIDMEADETASVIFSEEGVITFFSPNNPVVSFQDPALRNSFALIWLGDKTSHPSLRKKLLGK